jgi:hypothetical protein
MGHGKKRKKRKNGKKRDMHCNSLQLVVLLWWFQVVIDTKGLNAVPVRRERMG